MATIREIAKIAGVSTATVSKVINHKADSISEETKAKILSVIEEHNYVPFQKVVEQVSQKSNTVALLIADVSDIFGSELLRGVEDFFHEKELGVIVCSTDANPDRERRCLHMLKKQNVRGIIRFPIQCETSESVSNPEHEDIFSVILDDVTQPSDAMKTLFNNREGGRMAVSHLIDAGHERIGYITPQTQKPYLIKRYDGYRQALEERKIGFDDSIVYHAATDNRMQCGYDGTKYLLSRQVTSLFCSDDHVAAGAYRAIQESGLRIPHDISVVGFDDTFFSELLEPKLTSVKQSAYEIGQSSARLLYARISGEAPDQNTIEIQPKLMIRDSVASPNKEKDYTPRRSVVLGRLAARIEMQIEQEELCGSHQVQSYTVRAGGWAAEAAKNMREKGYEVYIAGYVGNDTYGSRVYDDLSAQGYRTDGILFHQESPTGMSFLTIAANGKVSEISHDGSNQALIQYPIRDIEWMLDKSDYCLLDRSLPEEMKQEMIKLCKGKHLPCNVG